MRHLLTAPMICLGFGCGPNTTEFFADPPNRHDLVGPIADTAWVENLTTDSVSAEGVRWLRYAAARSRDARRRPTAATLEHLFERLSPSVPDSQLERRTAELELWNRIGAQNVVQRMHMARTDVLSIESMIVDTLTRIVQRDSTREVHQWIAVVSSGRAWLDPEAGRRDDVR